jgi:predicted kinase
MIKLYVMCGVAGAGKTTYSKKLAKKQNLVRYSFDEMKCIRYGEITPLVIGSLKSGNNVVVDALYEKEKTRKELLSATEGIDCKRVLVFMDTPFEECVRRNAQRPKPLPTFVIKCLHETLECPTLNEGWDEIITIKASSGCPFCIEKERRITHGKK